MNRRATFTIRQTTYCTISQTILLSHILLSAKPDTHTDRQTDGQIIRAHSQVPHDVYKIKPSHPFEAEFIRTEKKIQPSLTATAKMDGRATFTISHRHDNYDLRG